MTARENYRAYREWRVRAAELLRHPGRDYKISAAASWQVAMTYRERFQQQLHGRYA